MSELTPQAQFLFELLKQAQSRDVSILAIAVAMSGPQATGWPPRLQQQRVGNRVSILNKQLRHKNLPFEARPGQARRTYRLYSVERKS